MPARRRALARLVGVEPLAQLVEVPGQRVRVAAGSCRCGADRRRGSPGSAGSSCAGSARGRRSRSPRPASPPPCWRRTRSARACRARANRARGSAGAAPGRAARAAAAGRRGAARAAGKPARGGVDQRPEVAEERLEVGRERRQVAQRRRQLARGRAQLRDERVGRRARSAVSRAIVARDSRSNVGRAMNACLQRVVARRRRREHARRSSRSGSRSWPSRSVSASKTDARVRDQPPHRRLLAVEDVDQDGGVLGERRRGCRAPSLRSRPWPVIASACVCIQTWNAARVRGSKVRRISSSSTVVGDLARRPAARPRASAARRSCPASARRRSPPAASSGAASRARPTAAARTATSSSIVTTRAARSRVSGSIALTLPDGHAGDPHVGLRGELGGLGERGRDAVALRLERDRAAEGQPQEQQQRRSTTARSTTIAAIRPKDGRGLLHQPAAPSSARWPGRPASAAGVSSSCVSTPSCGFCRITLSSSARLLAVDQRRGRGGAGRARPAVREQRRRRGG